MEGEGEEKPLMPLSTTDSPEEAVPGSQHGLRATAERWRLATNTTDASASPTPPTMRKKSPKKATPKKATPNKTTPNRTTPNKTTPNKTTPNRTAPNKTAANKLQKESADVATNAEEEGRRERLSVLEERLRLMG